MELIKRIDEIKVRADRIGLPLRVLCRRAGADYTSLWRWRRDGANPGMRHASDALTRIEATLNSAEQDLLAELAVLHPDVIERLAA